MRQVYFLDLRDDALAPEYDDWHRPGRVPAAVLDDIRASGVEAMEIYRCGERLVLISETQGASPVSDRVASPASRDWEVLMDNFHKPLPQAGEDEKWVEATKVFDLDQHRNQGRFA